MRGEYGNVVSRGLLTMHVGWSWMTVCQQNGHKRSRLCIVHSELLQVELSEQGVRHSQNT
jgi:hypothetical protein